MQQLGPRARWRLVGQTLLGAMVGAFLVGLYSLTTIPRVYRSTATLVFPLSSSGTSSLISSVFQNATEVPIGSDFPLDTYRAVLTSDRALLATAQALDLARVYKLENEQSIISFMKNSISAAVDVNRTLKINSQLSGTPSVIRPSDLVNRGAANARDEAYRELSAEVISELLRQMERIADEVKLDRSKAHLDAVSRQVAAQQEELDQSRKALASLQAELGNLDPEAYAQSLTQLVVRTRESVQQAEAELTEAQRQRAATAALIQQQSANVDELPEEVPFLLERRQAVHEARAVYEEQSRKYGPESPQVLNAQSELRRAERALNEALAAARAGLEPNLIELDAKIAALAGRVREARRSESELLGEAQQLPIALGDVMSLMDEVRLQQEALAQLERQRLAAQMEYERQGVRWNVLDVPRPPLSKAAPSTMKALLLGALLGALLFGWPALLLVWRLLLDGDRPEPVP